MTGDLSAMIRACIKKAGEPLSIGAIAKATEAPRARVSTACFNMARVGVLVKSGKPNCTQYFALGRELKAPGFGAAPTTKDPAYAERRCQARAEAAEGRRKQRETRQAEKLKRLEMAIAQAKKPARKRTAHEQPTLRCRLARPVPGTLNAAPKQRPAMTSDDFIRQGGKVERVPAAWERAA